MSNILSGAYKVYKAYTPNAVSPDGNTSQTKRFGAFKATYYYPLWKRPSNDEEAQALYNHTRTVAFWLDAAPLLTDLGLPFKVGLDEIISVIPLYGDLIAALLGLYQVYLSFLFGVDVKVLGWMLGTVIIDAVVGIVPLLGDYLDYLWKSNLRNLNTLEDWLLTSPQAEKYHILLMPQSKSHQFIPPTSKRSGSRFFGFGGKPSGPSDGIGMDGKVRKTRRMAKDEGELRSATPIEVGTGTGVPGPEVSAGQRRRFGS